MKIKLLSNYDFLPGADGTPDPVVVVESPLTVVVDEVSIVVEPVVVVPHWSPGLPQTALGSFTQINLHESNHGAIPVGQVNVCAIPIQHR